MKKLLIGLSALVLLLLSGCSWRSWLPPGPYSDALAKREYVSIYKKDCALNDGRGCYFLAYRYSMGYGVKRNKSKSVKYYSKACALNNGRGCSTLGKCFEDGKCGLKKNISKALIYYHKACDLNYHAGCSILGWRYLLGNNVKKDDAKAKMYLRKACDLGNTYSCLWHRRLSRGFKPIVLPHCQNIPTERQSK